MRTCKEYNIGTSAWYIGLDRSVRGKIALNEKSDGRIKIVFEQQQFVRASSTRNDVGIHESVSVYCDEKCVHLVD